MNTHLYAEMSKIKVYLRYEVWDKVNDELYSSNVEAFINIPKEFEEWDYPQQDGLLAKIFPGAGINSWDFTEE